MQSVTVVRLYSELEAAQRARKGEKGSVDLKGENDLFEWYLPLELTPAQFHEMYCNLAMSIQYSSDNPKEAVPLVHKMTERACAIVGYPCPKKSAGYLGLIGYLVLLKLRVKFDTRKRYKFCESMTPPVPLVFVC